MADLKNGINSNFPRQSECDFAFSFVVLVDLFVVDNEVPESNIKHQNQKKEKPTKHDRKIKRIEVKEEEN